MDPIGDMIIRIKNASDAQQASTLIPYSNLKMTVAQLLEKEGYITNVVKKGKKVKKFIEVGLIYNADKTPKITGVQRISKLSRRVYSGVGELATFRRNAPGMIVVTTPKGVLSDTDAQKEKVGGEVLFKIW